MNPQGVSIFDEALFEELERLTVQALAGFRKAGFTSDERIPAIGFREFGGRPCHPGHSGYAE